MADIPKTPDEPPLKVGDTIYYFDINRRVYSKPEPGRLYGSMIYAEQFRATTITGETSRSWIAEHGHKAAKADLRQPEFIPWRKYFTARQMQDAIWRNEHLQKIKEALDRAAVADLRAVANVIGYKAE